MADIADAMEGFFEDLAYEKYIWAQRFTAVKLREIGFTAQELAIYDERITGVQQRLNDVIRRKGRLS